MALRNDPVEGPKMIPQITQKAVVCMDKEDRANSDAGKIDSIENLKDQPVLLMSGMRDNVNPPPVTES